MNALKIIGIMAVGFLLTALVMSFPGTNSQSQAQPTVIKEPAITDQDVLTAVKEKIDNAGLSYTSISYRNEILTLHIDGFSRYHIEDKKSLVDSLCKITHSYRGNPKYSSTWVYIYDGSRKIAFGEYFPGAYSDTKIEIY